MQEVGGSSPPVPTMFSRPTPTVDSAIPHESGHRHAAGWIDARRSGRDTRPGCRRWDLATTAKVALAATVDGQMVDLSYPLERDAAVQIVTPDSPDALRLYRHSTAHLLAAAVTALFPEAQCGIGPAIEDGFFYDFVVDRPFVPEDLEAIEKKMDEIAKRKLRYERKMMTKERGEGLLRRPRRAAQGPAHRRKRRARRLVLHDRGRLHRLLHRPARAVDREAQGVQGAPQLQRLLEGRRAESADATHLRYGVLQGLRAQEASEQAGGSEEARPPQARPGARPLYLSPLGARGAVLARQRRDALPDPERLHARRAVGRGLPGGPDAAGLQQAAVGDLRALGALPRAHVPGGVRRRAVRPEGDELPGPHVDVRERGTQLSRPPAALARPGRAASGTRPLACCRG